MRGSCGHRPRLVITTHGIDLSTACLLILLLLLLRPLPRQRLAHELCGNIDQLIESYCLEPWVIIEGGISQLLFCACALEECITQLLVTHTCAPLSSPQICNGYTSVQAHMAACAINTAQMTACIDCLPFAIMFPLFTFQHLTHSNGIQ